MKKLIVLFLFISATTFSQEIALLKYNGGGDWYANPTSLPNLIKFCNQTIGTKIKTKNAVVTPSSPDIFSYPYVHATGHGNVVFNPSEIENFIDKPLTPSEWYSVTQEKINDFANATSDHQWIHIDEERAKKEMPEGKTIAHGYFMVSLLPKLAAQNAEIKNSSRTLNYGSDKVRFINMVKVGSQVRLNRTIISCEKMKNGGFRVVNKCELEIKDENKPAFIAETISLVFP